MAEPVCSHLEQSSLPCLRPGPYPYPVTLRLLVFGVLGLPAAIALGAIIWGGGSLLIDAWHCRHPRPELIDRLDRFQPPSLLADEIERWLKRQS